MFLKRKKSGKLKAYGCVFGQLQREYLSKNDSSSPRVSIYALMVSCVMSTMEERKVFTFYILGEFQQCDWPKVNNYYIKFEGIMVKMLCDIDQATKERYFTPGMVEVSFFMESF